MAYDVRAMIAAKSGKKVAKKLTFNDINRGLIVSLLAEDVYGKEARDEEILSAIINAGRPSGSKPTFDRIRERYEKMVDNKEVHRVKGETRDKDGFLVLEPRN